MINTEDITKEALKLPEDQKLSLAHRLLQSIEPDESHEISKAWDLEIQKRIDQYDRGEIAITPATEVFDELNQWLSGK